MEISESFNAGGHTVGDASASSANLSAGVSDEAFVEASAPITSSGDVSTPATPPAKSSATATSPSDTSTFQSGEVGTGVHLLEIDRMRKVLSRCSTFSEKVFSEEERQACDKEPAPEIHYAMRFAAKQAVCKSLGADFLTEIGVRDIEILRNAKGKYSVELSGPALAISKAEGVLDLPISLTFTHTEVAACAMAITENSKRASENRKDPMEELSKQFKSARCWLDEL